MFLRPWEQDSVLPKHRMPSINTTRVDNLIIGIYDYYSSENFNAYLEELGVPWYLREAAGMATPTITISKIHQNCPRYYTNVMCCNTVILLKFAGTLLIIMLKLIFRHNYYFQTTENTD